MPSVKKLLILSTAFAIGVIGFSCARYLLGGGASLLIAPMLGIFGVVVICISTWYAAKHRTRLALLSVVIATATWVAWIFAPLDLAGVYVKFWFERSSYDVAVAETIGGKEPACVLTRKCEFQKGVAANLAFPWEGIIDNWIGVVHDPSGEIVDVERFKSAFGGDLLSCRHLSGPYFLCSFT